MNTGASLADRIRDKIAAHELPDERPEKTGNGHGTGKPCAACDQPILPAQTEHWLGGEGRITHRFHQGCHALWNAELYRRRWVLPGPRLGRTPVRAILAKLRANALPSSLPASARRTTGDGQPCAGCGEPLRPSHVTYELDFGGGRTIRLHAECERIWREATGN
jgi:hypothetical protein